VVVVIALLRIVAPTMILPSLSSNFPMERSAGEFDELEDFAAEPPERRIVPEGRRHCEEGSLAECQS